eukprot:3694921-Karenia_brevis.AAC.1
MPLSNAARLEVEESVTNAYPWDEDGGPTHEYDEEATGLTVNDDMLNVMVAESSVQTSLADVERQMWEWDYECNKNVVIFQADTRDP